MKRRRFLQHSAAALVGLGAASISSRAGAQSNPVLIGQSVDLSGPSQGLGRDYFTGAKLCFDVANSSGGIAGRPLRLLQIDDAGQPQRAVANTNRLLNEERVDYLFGLTGDSCIDAVVKSTAFRNSERLLFAPMSGADLASGSERVIYLRASYGEEIAAILGTFGGAGLKNFAIAHAASGTGIAARDAALALLHQRGLPQPKPVAIEADPRRIGITADAVLKAAPQAVVILADTIPTALLARELRSRSPGLFVCATSNADQTTLRELLGPQLATGIVLSRVVPDPLGGRTAVVREFSRAFDRYFDETPSTANLEGYLAAKLLVTGLQRAGGTLPPGRALAHFRGMRNTDLGGWNVDLSAANRAPRYVDTSVISRKGTLLG